MRARLDDPSGLVALRSGSLAFEQADPGHGPVIRQITPGGMIGTVAGLHPTCAGVPATATSMEAESAPLSYGALSANAAGVVLFGPHLCSGARRLGPFLQLTPTGELRNTEMDSSPLMLSLGPYLPDCGPSAGGSGFTVLFCDSGAGHPKELLVLRENGTTKAYPVYNGGAFASAGGVVVAQDDYGVVRVASQRLHTVASSNALDRFFPGTVGVAGITGLAVDRSGNVFVDASYYAGHRRGCGNAIGEITTAGQLKPLWRSTTGLVCR